MLAQDSNKAYKKIDQKDIDFFIQLLGSESVGHDNDTLYQFSKDETEDLVFSPELVLYPRNTDDVSQIVKYAAHHHIPLTPRGAGTGLSGGSLAVKGGISIAFAKMNSIINFDIANAQIICQPGVITQDLQKIVEEAGLFYPPDPSSKGTCQIGGNVAENAGGPRAVKYGATKDYILNLQIVLANGDVIWTGANVLKNSTGYNLTQLIVGSEGTLAIVTQIVIKLIPKPLKNLTLLISFRKIKEACEAVSAIFQSGITPSACEFMERDAIQLAVYYLDNIMHQPSSVKISIDTEALLLIEVDGFNDEINYKQVEKLTSALESYDIVDILLADDEQKKSELWSLRRCIGHAVKSQSAYKEVDTVVPRSQIGNLITKVKSLQTKYGFQSYCYGHAGDGNLHVNILKENITEAQWKNNVSLGVKEIFQFVIEKNGTLSGEHGIGYLQKEYMSIAFDTSQLSLMKSIKKIFDPNNILNPSKVLLLT